MSEKISILVENVRNRNLVEFATSGEQVYVQALEDTILILGHALPIHEPMVAQGPFVMNTLKKIVEAYADYQTGKFGPWTL